MRASHVGLLGILSLAGAARAGAPAPRLEPSVRAYYVVLRGESIGEATLGGRDRQAARDRLSRQHARIEGEVTRLGARPVARLKNLTNAVQVLATPTQAARLSGLDEVLAVEQVPEVRRRNTSAVPFVGAYRAWSQSSVHGEGVRIGVIDTGIDYLHADFGGPGTPEAYSDNDPAEIEPGTFPTAKVIGGHDFVGDKYDPSGGKPAPVPDDDPLDCAGLQQMNISGGHGTHVAGTAAGQGVTADGKPFTGPYEQSLNPSQFRVGPGVAPAARLFALKVFGCEGSTTMVAAALDRAADPDDDGDTSDRLDVINMSLGGSYGLATPTDQKMVRVLTELGAFVAVAAGNDGDAFFVTGAPATYDEAMSVAAVTDTVSFATLTVDAPASVAGDYPASEAAFTKPLLTTGPLSGTLAATSPASGCSSLTNPAEIAGKIALVQRGGCTFVNKVKFAEAAGAIGVVIVDNQESDVPFSASGSGGPKAGVPGVMIRKVHGDAISAALGAGVTVTIDASKVFASNLGADQIARFTSRGPRAPDLALKPEIAAPGVAIDSAGVGSGSDPRELSGTSMACPVVAGAAALLRQARPAASTATMKALMMNTASAITDDEAHPAPVSRVGSGRLNIDQALARTTFAHVVGRDGEVAASFGALVVSSPATRSLEVAVENFGASSASYELDVAPTRALPGVSVRVTPASVVVPAGGKATVTLELAVDPVALGAPGPDDTTSPTQNQQARHFLVEAGGHLTMKGAAGDLVLPYHGVVRAAAERAASPLGCVPDGGEITLEIGGPSAHPDPATSVFALGATSPRKTSSDDPLLAPTDILATGASTNLPTAESFDKASVYFAVAVAGPWATPALGPLSAVSIEIDTDADGEADFQVRAEPMSATYFGDVLTATTYTASTQQPTPSRRFLNIVPASTLDTHPFLNDVVIFPVTLKDLGLSPGHAKIAYRAVTQGVPKGSDTSPYATFDVEAPGVQPKGGLNGSGLFASATSPKVTVDAGRSLLVLHHANVPSKRFEVLAPASSGNLAITGEATSPIVATFTVTNTAGGARDGAKVTVTAAGGALGVVSLDGAECPSGVCQVASIAAGEAAKITASSSEGATLTATLAAPGCEPDTSDDTATVSLGAGGGAGGAGGKAGGAGRGTAASPTASAPTPDGPYEASGGCDCATVARGPGAAAWLALAGLVGLGARRRRSVG